MALEDLNPAVRAEEILNGGDIEPATRLEYFMKKAANEVPKPAGSSDAGKVLTVNEDGDGFELGAMPSALPSYTSADKGKFLGLGEGEGGETVVIVPEQTVTLENGAAPLQNVTISYDDLTVGMTATLYFTYGAQTLSIDMTVVENTSGQTTFLYFTDETRHYTITYVERNSIWSVYAEDVDSTPLSGECTVSLTYFVPSVEPKWEGVGGYIHNASRAFESGVMGLLQTAVTTLVQNNKTFAEAYGVILANDDSAAVLAMAQNPTRVNVWHALNQDFVVLRSNDNGNDNGSITVVLPYYEQVVANTLAYFLSITFTMNSDKSCFVRVFVLGKST